MWSYWCTFTWCGTLITGKIVMYPVQNHIHFLDHFRNLLRNKWVFVPNKVLCISKCNNVKFILSFSLNIWFESSREYRAKTPFVGIMSGRDPQLLILDSAVAKDILIKDFKNFHDNQPFVISVVKGAPVDNVHLLSISYFCLDVIYWRSEFCCSSHIMIL